MGSRGTSNINFTQFKNTSQIDTFLDTQKIKLTNNQRQTLEEYKIQSGELNIGLRTNKISDKDYRVKDLDSILNKSQLNDNIVVYRGIQNTGFAKSGIDFKNPENNIGKTITDKGYMSTSLHPGVMKSFVESHPESIGIIIKAPKGASAVSMNSANSKYGMDEKEILFNRNTALKITGTKDIKGKKYLIATMK